MGTRGGIARAISMIGAIAVAAVGLFLMASLAGAGARAASLDGMGTGSDPRIETCTVVASLPISDTRPGDGVAKTVYFNNTSGGVITATFGVSGTPALALVADSAFGKPMSIYTSSLAQASFVVTYAVATTHTQSDVIYTAMNANFDQASVTINYARDITAPVVTVTAPTESYPVPFAVSWEAVDPSPGSGVSASYAVLYREDDGVWVSWLPSTTLTESTFFSATVDHTYTFSVTVHDWVDNPGEGMTATYIERYRVYLPVVVSNWVGWYEFDVYEPNDKISQAYGPLTSTQVYTAYIWDTTDTDDYYHFTPATTGTVQISLTNIPDGVDYDLYVYYHDGEQFQVMGQSNRSGNQDEDVAFTPVANTTYYIRVHPYSGSSHQPYRLTVTYD